MFKVIARTSIRYSSYSSIKRNTLSDIYEVYKLGKPISVVTSHDYISAKMAEECQFDINLVGDSLAMVALGYEDTNEIPFEEMLYHIKLVYRGNKKSFILADLPFGSYEKSHEQAIESCIKMVKYGKANGIKIEGGEENFDLIRKITSIGIPVMAHTGLTPQHHNVMGGFKLQGNTKNQAIKIYNDCLSLQKAGAFLILLECVPNRLAQEITNKLSVPTIGIGAGPYCSGQVLVMADVLGMNNNPHQPKFVKSYENFFEKGVAALNNYQNEVKNNQFPLADVHGYKMKSEVLNELKEYTKLL